MHRIAGMTARVGLAVLATAALSFALVPPVAANTPVTITMSVSKNPVWPDTDVTFKAIVKPASGPTTRLGLTMQSSRWATNTGSFSPYMGTCQPSAYCSVGSNGDPSWDFPDGISAQTTLTYSTRAPQPGETVTTYIWTDGIGCVSCSPTVTMKRPTITLTATRTSTGVVMPGDSLHIRVYVKNNVATRSLTLGPSLDYSSGIGTPTNVTPGWELSPKHLGSTLGDYEVTTSNVAILDFDTVVTGALGSTISFTPAGYGAAPNTYAYKIVPLKIKIGPTSTPKPPAASTTRPATPKPTAVAASPSPGAPSAPPSLDPGSPSPPASLPAPTSTLATPSTPAPTAAPATDPASGSGGLPIAGVAIGLVVLLVAAGGLLRFRRRAS